MLTIALPICSFQSFSVTPDVARFLASSVSDICTAASITISSLSGPRTLVGGPRVTIFQSFGISTRKTALSTTSWFGVVVSAAIAQNGSATAIANAASLPNIVVPPKLVFTSSDTLQALPWSGRRKQVQSKHAQVDRRFIPAGQKRHRSDRRHEGSWPPSDMNRRSKISTRPWYSPRRDPIEIA